MNKEFIIELGKYIEQTEREAAEIMMAAHDIISESKTDARNVVTEYDRRVQDRIIERLSEKLPGAKFFCEENDRHDELSAEHLFIIDPIDGTMNFVRGLKKSCISVAYASCGELLAAAVYNPYSDEMFSAVKGEGAFLNAKPIRVDDSPLNSVLAAVGTTPYDPELADESFAHIRRLYIECLDIRREGSAALDMCSAAAGRVGIYFELLVSLWDIAAGMLIVSEAGGISLNKDGRPATLRPERQSIISGSKQCVTSYLRQA